MRKLIVVGLVGVVAQLVDGALGMAFGVTSTSLVLSAGLAPAVASASVHLAEVGTCLASGGSHWKLGNVDWHIVGRLALPGAIGGFAGATFLSSLSTESAEPWMAGILLALGAYILVRFTLGRLKRVTDSPPLRTRFLGPLGLVAGFVDATGGGGWGPVATPSLLVAGRTEPRKVIGSVDTSEFVVALAASVGFLVNLGSEGVNLGYAGALFAGGLVAAPFAAWLVRKLHPRMLGSLVGGLIVLTNVRTLLRANGWDGGANDQIAYLVVAILWAAAVAWSYRCLRRDRVPVVQARPSGEPAPASA